MNKEEIIDYWIKSSDKDFKTMTVLFKEKQYSWCLFVGHLVVEKLLKAYYVSKKDDMHPLTHDLVRLAEKSDLDPDEKLKEFLATVTTFNINARYDDYKTSFNKVCTKDYTELWYSEITKYRKWIKKTLLNR
ncbi:MAG: DNA-binding protein [Bacteroidetes bacterium GWF2_38_335]|nr:MAG: DNA-binding protein [Bacteroidetes bacterium GWF2_38_335]OFY81919.1 MAG: DNA-binding protein [Bacteroidetes bacterium RIFOXYA12_FULL_38_20]